MLKYLERLRGASGISLSSACSMMGCVASGCGGGSEHTGSLMHGHKMIQHTWAPSSFISCTYAPLGRRPLTGLCQAALRLKQIPSRAISPGHPRHLCGLSIRPFTSSSRLCAINKARSALPVEAFEGPKRYAFRQKKWHKKIDKKRPNMPPREPLPPRHPARIIQSERREQPTAAYMTCLPLELLDSHASHDALQ